MNLTWHLQFPLKLGHICGQTSPHCMQYELEKSVRSEVFRSKDRDTPATKGFGSQVLKGLKIKFGSRNLIQPYNAARRRQMHRNNP